MNLYSPFDYLCNEPFFIREIGNLKSPTLRDIRKVSYSIFSCFLNLMLYTPQECAKMLELEEQYNALDEKGKEMNTVYNLLLYNNIQLLFSALSFFIEDTFEFDEKTLSFQTYKMVDDKKQIIGHVGNDNFEQFRLEVQRILGLKNQEEEQEQKFKNKTAKKLFEKLQKHAKEQKKKSDENYTLDNMIKKYCTHNKVGINILNVWDMTYYQFTSMFNEYCNGRQCDFNDMMAANTFSYKKSTDYKPLDYIKKLNNN